jgi:hypothetical protein
MDLKKIGHGSRLKQEKRKAFPEFKFGQFWDEILERLKQSHEHRKFLQDYFSGIA